MNTIPKTVDWQQVCSLYEAGYDINTISDIVKRSPTLIRHVLYKSGRVDPDGLDGGKCRALAKAGWSIDKIHDEFSGRFTKEEIRKALQQLRP